MLIFARKDLGANPPLIFPLKAMIWQWIILPSLIITTKLLYFNSHLKLALEKVLHCEAPLLNLFCDSLHSLKQMLYLLEKLKSWWTSYQRLLVTWVQGMLLWGHSDLFWGRFDAGSGIRCHIMYPRHPAHGTIKRFNNNFTSRLSNIRMATTVYQQRLSLLWLRAHHSILGCYWVLI